MIKLHDMLLAGQAGVFTHDGEDFLMSCQKGSTVFFPVQIRLPATKIGWRGAIILLQLLLLYGTMKSYGGWKRLESVETVLCPYFRSSTFIKGVSVWINSKQH